jgi:hypothetical protein
MINFNTLIYMYIPAPWECLRSSWVLSSHDLFVIHSMLRISNFNFTKQLDYLKVSDYKSETRSFISQKNS